MRKEVDRLSEGIGKIEARTISFEELDQKLESRLKVSQRQSTLIELRTALIVLELQAKERVSLELFIQVTPLKQPIIKLNSYQKYRFKLITLQEIELKVEHLVTERINILPYIGNRLTAYIEFKDRSQKLLRMIQAGILDDCIKFSASELLFRIMGDEGELLERMGVNIADSYTSSRIFEIVSNRQYRHTQLHNLLNLMPESRKEERAQNPVPPILRNNFFWGEMKDE